MKLEFSRQIFEIYPNIKYRENPSNGSRFVPYGQTDRHDKANGRFSQNFERARNSEYRVLETSPDLALSWRCGRGGRWGGEGDRSTN
jgi:hypothetical protein